MTGAKVEGALVMNRANIFGSVFMGDRAKFGNVSLPGAHIRGGFDMSGTKVTGMLNMDLLNVDRDLLMGDGAEFKNVSLPDAHVGGRLDMGGTSRLRKKVAR